MGKLIYVTGGARSGKSRFAQALAEAGGGPVTYIATAVACDGEMDERIARHRQSRPAHWRTVEAWKDMDGVFASLEPGCVVLDCVTVMATNLILEEPGVDWDRALTVPAGTAGRIEARVMDETEKLLSGIAGHPGRVIVVSNEVGLGLAPAYPLGRIFRDIAGRVNQSLAARAEEAWLLVSGIPLRLK